MTELTEEDALQYLKNAFSKHPVTRADAQAARRQLGAYTASLAKRIEGSASPESENVDQIPITGTRREYLQAVRHNAITKRQRDAAIASMLDRQPTENKTHTGSAATGLAPHLELLRQRRRHQRLSAIEHFLAGLENLKDELRGQELERERHEYSAPPTGAESIGTGHQDVEIRDLIAKLEYAVIQSDSEAKQERRWLQSAQAEVDPLHEINAAREYQALSAVRDELTKWLEESLEQCAATDDGGDEEPQDVDFGDQDGSELVRAEYERYLEARQRLLRVTQSLQSPQGGSKQEFSTPEDHRPESSATPLTDQALTVEASLTQRQLQESLQLLKSYTTDELAQEGEESLEALLRLVDESQLLPEYPMLVRDKRFDKVIGSLGSQLQQASDDKVTEQVEAWRFAADAADKSLDAAVSGHVKKATQALDNVDEMLQDLRFLRDETD